MKFIIKDYIPVSSIPIQYKDSIRVYDHVLVDTGCSSTILDTDLAQEIEIIIDLENAITREMFGIGGSEICIEQKVENLIIDKYKFDQFTIQLGDIKELYGFDAILGNDFFMAKELLIDFYKYEINAPFNNY
ncbi:hypothetical protein CIB95_09080 [Lottiidibacillus patelloidae]|uniref:Peptidase A2 domain-containing protein n=1 Tax=Lottiidibacillus patelloidae TaxID=2670334 RepID=A0A263BT70_9BACI|nr:aspartyl protease family protein [Lottiidibacillus patelloidae]OZM56913.1 hypothetical protein CIB95_09080 [Lottiidibacillus patelloidae]